NTYIHRLIYIGQHSFGQNPTVQQFFEDIIKSVNIQDPDESLTGFLLHYEHLFIHIVEGSQATILRHLRRIFKAIDEGKAQLETMKVLITCHNIYQVG
ncbi:hypothetical protein C0J52_10364, partial [Blattella germanica]